MDAGSLCQTTVVVPEHPVEDVDDPEWLVPYTAFEQGEVAEITVTLRVAPRRDGREPMDKDRFQIPMPIGVRRLGNSGPGRVVMALVACARAGGRVLTEDDLDYIRVRFVEGYPLDERGLEWLAAWTKELATAALSRLSPDAVATRLATHVDESAAERVLTWLMHGARASWPGEAAERFIAGLARHLGIDARLDALWRQVAAEPDPVALARAAEVLGFSVGAPADDAKRAYRALMQRWHPDRARTPEEASVYTERTVRINAAWQVFSRGR
jgi:DnaJ-domain-containing protein 1